jgi:hypothetical protein
LYRAFTGVSRESRAGVSFGRPKGLVASMILFTTATSK